MRLSTREKGIIAAAGVLIAVLAFWLGVWEPARAHLELLDRRVRAKQTEYRTIQELAARYRRLQGKIEAIEAELRRSRNFSLLSFLEGLARQRKVQDRIVQMKPKGGETTRYYKENGVEVRMEKVRLAELVEYLYYIEHSQHLLRVKQLRINPRFDDPDLLDVRFQVSAYEPLKGS
ncbi:MAG: hypothetical protein Kow0092_12630 [Deferrisomatales bacterium]